MPDAKKNQKWILVIGMKKLFFKNILKLKKTNNNKKNTNKTQKKNPPKTQNLKKNKKKIH